MNTLLILPNGIATCLYTEIIPLDEIGTLHIERISNIEFHNDTQFWQVLRSEEILFKAKTRQECLDWEAKHLQPTPTKGNT